MKDEIVNLYMVYPVNAEYCYFAFASTPNKARSLCVNYLTDDEPYIDMRAYIRAKNVGGTNNTVVDSPEDKDYDRVLAAGCRYLSESEI
jgi:hypothetical protein